MVDKPIDWKSLVEGASRAPSGDNTQPWEVSTASNTLELYYVPVSNPGPYDVGNVPDYLSLGAWLHNLKVLASHAGYHAAISLTPSGNIIARVTLEPGDKKIGSAVAVLSRRTNRFSYEKASLSPEQKSRLEQVLVPHGVSVRWIEGKDKEEFRDIAPELHRIFWEFEEHRRSLLSTLCVGSAKNAVVGMHRSHLGIAFKGISAVLGVLAARRSNLVWKIMRIITSGIERRNLQHSGTVAFLFAKTPQGIAIGTHREFWVTTGMALEEFWLEAGEAMLAVQPFYTIVVLGLRKFFRLPTLSKKYPALERRAQEFLDAHRPYENAVAFMCFRVGIPKKTPASLSLRKPFEKTLRAPQDRDALNDDSAQTTHS